MVSRHLSGQLLAGLSVGTVQSSGLVSEEPGEGSNRPPAPHPRSGACPTAVWLPADLGVTAAGGLARESETSTTALSIGWVAAADARATAETHRLAPRSGAGSSGPDRALEHGFRP